MTKEDLIKLLNKGVITHTGLIDSKGNIKYDGDLDDLANKFITQTGITDGTSAGNKTSEWIDKHAMTDKDNDGKPDPKNMPLIEVSGLENILPYSVTTKATVKITANDYAGANVTLTWDAVGAVVKIANKDSWSVKSLKDKELVLSVTPKDNEEVYSIAFHFVDDQGNVLAEPVVNFNVQAKAIDTASLKAAIAERSEVTLESDIDLSEQIVVNKELVLNLNGKTLTNSNDIWNDGAPKAWSHISVQGGDLTINGEGSMIAKANDCYALDIRGGNLTINGGTYNGNITAVYSLNGIVKINGGSFDVQQVDNKKGKAFMLNCQDAAYKSGAANFIVAGGSFNGFNPGANAAESADDTTNFLAEGYTVTETDGVFTVVKA